MRTETNIFSVQKFLGGNTDIGRAQSRDSKHRAFILTAGSKWMPQSVTALKKPAKTSGTRKIPRLRFSCKTPQPSSQRKRNVPFDQLSVECFQGIQRCRSSRRRVLFIAWWRGVVLFNQTRERVDCGFDEVWVMHNAASHVTSVNLSNLKQDARVRSQRGQIFKILAKIQHCTNFQLPASAKSLRVLY